jgi:RNA polymerase sigma factor (sigma-70 family)
LEVVFLFVTGFSCLCVSQGAFIVGRILSFALLHVVAPTRKITELTDSELIARFRVAQDQAYFTLLYRRYAGKVFAKCISMLSDEALARDATQEIFIKILLNLTKFNELSSFSTWVYSITYNYCIDVIRKKKKMPLLFTEDVSRIKDAPEVEIPDSILLEMKQDRLAQVLDLLPAGDKAILLMKYIDDLQIRDIAEILNKTESAIKMQIMRAKIKAQSLHDDLFGLEALEETDYTTISTKYESSHGKEQLGTLASAKGDNAPR